MYERENECNTCVPKLYVRFILITFNAKLAMAFSLRKVLLNLFIPLCLRKKKKGEMPYTALANSSSYT